MATDGWYVPAIDNHAARDGGHLEEVTIGVLHTTESTRFVPNSSNYFGHQSYPHFTVVNDNGTFKSYQHISIRRAAMALKNLSGGVQTNNAGVIQIEVVGTATKPFTSDPVLVAGLSALMRWIEAETNIPSSSTVEWLAYPASYGKSRVRLSNALWNAYAGWLGHQHAPENSHGDPGAIDIAALLPSRQGSLTTPVNEVLQEAEMFIVKDPQSNAQYKTDGFRKVYLDGPAYLAWRNAGIKAVALPLSEFQALTTISPA
jgi:hypothetical protein